jgi:hypothetical protein
MTCSATSPEAFSLSNRAGAGASWRRRVSRRGPPAAPAALQSFSEPGFAVVEADVVARLPGGRWQSERQHRHYLLQLLLQVRPIPPSGVEPAPDLVRPLTFDEAHRVRRAVGSIRGRGGDSVAHAVRLIEQLRGLDVASYSGPAPRLVPVDARSLQPAGVCQGVQSTGAPKPRAVCALQTSSDASAGFRDPRGVRGAPLDVAHHLPSRS